MIACEVIKKAIHGVVNIGRPKYTSFDSALRYLVGKGFTIFSGLVIIMVYCLPAVNKKTRISASNGKTVLIDVVVLRNSHHPGHDSAQRSQLR